MFFLLKISIIIITIIVYNLYLHQLYDKLIRFSIMTIKKYPVRAQFVNSHIVPSSLKLEIFKVDDNSANRLLKNCGLSVSVGDVVVLLYLDNSADYFVFDSIYNAVRFCSLNGIL